MNQFVVFDTKSQKYRNPDDEAKFDDIDKVLRYTSTDEAVKAIIDRFDQPMKFEVHEVCFKPTILEKFCFGLIPKTE